MKKVYVTVQAEYKTNGFVTPRKVTWNDGREFDIDKILDVRKAASLNVGGQGYRFTCRICGKEKYLFLEDSKWFMEGKESH